MGTTLDALNAGSLTYKYVVAIEGYSRLLTSASTLAATNAWTGTDWTQALGGLFVELDNESRAHPWEPFQGGGTCTLRVMDTDGTDVFGIDTHRKLAGAETYLTGTADRFATTINVKDTTAFASSGEAFIGTECFAYSGKTSTSFTGCTRGRYASVQTSTGAAWAGFHRQGQASNRVSLDPVVSAQPRTWLGKWVAVWVHRDVGGVLDVKAQAQLVYAGKIVEIRDDPTGFTVVQLKHVLDTIGEAMLGRDPYMATVIEGIYLKAGMYLGITDWSPHPGTFKTANNLVCVASGASGSNQFNQGYYTLGQVCDIITGWLAGELAASRIFGNYWMASPVPSPKGFRTKVYWKIPNAGTVQVHWTMRMPQILAIFFGFSQERVSDALDSFTTLVESEDGRYSNTDWLTESRDVPLRAILTHIDWGTNALDVRMGLQNETGVFVDQRALLPGVNQTFATALAPGLGWGIFSFNDAAYMLAAKDGAELRFMLPAIGFSLPGGATGSAPWSGPTQYMTVKVDQTADIVVRQVLALEDTFSRLLKQLFYGSGSPDFNSLNFDELGYGLGIGIPGSLLGAAFEASCDALPNALASVVVVVDKPTKLTDLLSADMVLRWSFPRWRQGVVTFASWKMPTNVDAVAVLTENTKARPASTAIDDRAATSLSEEWRRDIITMLYNRDATSTDNYLSKITFEDATSVDDSGGEGRPVTIKARNTYGQFTNTGQGIEQLAPNFLALLPLFSRPFRKQTLSIGPALYEQVAPGDVVTVSESFARDPATGTRGIFSRPALVIRARYNRGGAQPRTPTGLVAQGEVDIMYGPDQSRPAPYSYAATVDETQNAGGFTAGYNNGTLTLRCKTHDNSDVTEARDASRFVNGDKILIVERDPANSASPISWSRTVSGTPVNDDIVLNSALSSPTFDAAKKYRIIYDHFAAMQQSQQVLAAQADDADALIENLAPPFQYVQATSLLGALSYDPTIPVELVPDLSFGDGKPLDVGHEFALVQLADVLEDYRCARHEPHLVGEELSNSTGTGTYQLLAYYPVHLSIEILPIGASRVVSVAPFFRSITGASVNIRISLCRKPPEDDTLFDVGRPAVFSEAVFTTSSTTYSTPASQDLDANVKDSNGIAWVWIEGTFHAATWGVAQFDESERFKF